MARHKHFEMQLPNDWRESFKKMIECFPPDSRKQGLRVIQSPHTEKAYQYLLGESGKVFLTDDRQHFRTRQFWIPFTWWLTTLTTWHNRAGDYRTYLCEISGSSRRIVPEQDRLPMLPSNRFT